MSALRRPASLRWRLTAWYTAALGGLLLVLGGVALALLDRGLRANVDASLASVARALAVSSRSEESLPTGPERALRDFSDFFGPALGERFFQFRDPFGRPEPRRQSQSEIPLPLSATARTNAEEGRETWETVALSPAAAPVRLLTVPVMEHGELVHVVQVAMPLSGVNAARTRFLLILLALAPFALAGIAVGGWMLAGRALKPVDSMVAAARRISAQDLSLRIDTESRDDELGRLAGVLNEMLARIERSFAAARDFSANAAHELRTPLTILKGEIEVALRSVSLSEGPRRAFESCLEEVDRLSALVEDLLFLARADAGAIPRPAGTVDLAQVLDDARPALAALAERAGVILEVREKPGVGILGSPAMLLRVVFNLVDNAIKHSGRGHRVEVDLGASDGRAVLEVRDDGPGVSEGDRERIFERFYRGDPSHSGSGAGLGLALVRSIVAVHGGEIRLDSRPGQGACFRVFIPLGH